MKNNWKEEFYKVFEINQGSGRINGYITKNVGEDYSRPATVEDFEMYVEALLEEQKKELMGTFVNIVEKEQSKNYPFYDAKDGWREGRQEIAEDILESLNHHE